MSRQPILESCLDAIRNGVPLASCHEMLSELSPEEKAILEAAARIHTASRQLTPDQAFKQRARSNLMQRIANEQQTAAPAARPTPTFGKRWRQFWVSLTTPQGLKFQTMAAAIALVLVFVLSAGVVSAAKKSLPGAPLYPLKRLSEQTQTLIKKEDVLWQLTLAQRRLDEAERLADAGERTAMDALLAEYTAILTQSYALLEKSMASGEMIPTKKILVLLSQQQNQLQRLQASAAGHESSIDAAIRANKAMVHLLNPEPQTTPTPLQVPTATIPVAPASTGAARHLTPTHPAIKPTRTPSHIPVPAPTQTPLPRPTNTALPPTPMPSSPTAMPHPPTQTPTQIPQPPTVTPVPTAIPPTRMPATQPPATPTIPRPTATVVPPTPRPPAPTSVPTIAAPMPTAAPPMPTMAPPSMPSIGMSGKR